MTGTPDPDWSPPGAAPQGNRFFQKLGVYLLGVAIGLAFLGWVQYRKSLAVKQQQAAQAEQTAEQAPATPAPATQP